jgi:hypothetical protein
MNNWRKFQLYILSLGLLFLFFIILTVDMPLCFSKNCKFIGFSELFFSNVIPTISIILLICCFCIFEKFKYDISGTHELPFQIKTLESMSYDHLTFLATYLIPLISFDLSDCRQLIVLFLLLIVMGGIYVKTDLFYANPSLALLGFYIYRADGWFVNGERKSIVLICQGRLEVSQSVTYIKLDDKIYYVEKC